MIDQKVGNRISERGIAARVEAGKSPRILAVDQARRSQVNWIDCPDIRTCNAVRLLSASKPPVNLPCVMG